MNILIVVATSNELLRNQFTDCEVLISGVGMIYTTISLTKELMQNNYDLVINVGIAGSFVEKFKIGDVVEVVEDCFSEIGTEVGDKFLTPTQLNLEIKNTFFTERKTDLNKAIGITVNTVHGKASSIEKIRNRLNPDIESMEGAAVMMVCEQFNTPTIQIRAISNILEERNKENWNIPMAVKNLNTEIRRFIDTQ